MSDGGQRYIAKRPRGQQEQARQRQLDLLREHIGDRKHACLSVHRLAAEVGLTAQAVRARLHGLAQRGLIRDAPCVCNALQLQHRRISLVRGAAPRSVAATLPQPAVSHAKPAQAAQRGQANSRGTRPYDAQALAALEPLLKGQSHACVGTQQLAQQWSTDAAGVRERLWLLIRAHQVFASVCSCSAIPQVPHHRLRTTPPRASARFGARQGTGDDLAQAFVLGILRAHPARELSVADLAAATDDFSAQQLLILLTGLFHRGVVLRERDPSDGRTYWSIKLDAPDPAR